MPAETHRAPSAIEYPARSRRDLFRDRDLIGSGWKPPYRVYSEAPVLDDWQACEHAPSAEFPEGSTTLSGTCSGHPFFDDGYYVSTCALSFWDGIRFARTQTGWWRLGEPKNPSIHDMTETRCPPPDDDYGIGGDL
jgi:hypothetical protein